MNDLSNILLHRLYYLCSMTFNAQARMMMLMGLDLHRTLMVYGVKWKDNLLGGEWIKLLESYPVLAKRIGITMEYFISFIEEFLDRFYENKDKIEKHFFGRFDD